VCPIAPEDEGTVSSPTAVLIMIDTRTIQSVELEPQGCGSAVAAGCPDAGAGHADLPARFHRLNQQGSSALLKILILASSKA